VKPSNITLAEDMTPVLLDFGLALTEDEVAAPDGVVAGTMAYMSPEQASGAGHRLDGRTDIFSLGVVLYEMLCGRRPSRAEDSEEILRQVREDEPQPPRQLVPAIPRELERICLKALAKRINDRYTTAGDFAEELRRVLLNPESVAPAAASPHPDAPTVNRPPEKQAAAPAQKFDKLVAHLRLHKLDQPEPIALFAALLSLPLDNRYPELALSPQRQKDRTL
jgi:serine/threonine protein kinase